MTGIKRFNFSSAIFASIIATIVMTIVMYFFGMDFMKMLGNLAGMTGIMGYIVGGCIHLIVGIIYGLIYALIFEPIFHRLPGFLAGAIYSLLPFIIAMTMFGTFARFVQKTFGVEQKTEMMCAPSNMQEEENVPTHKSQPMLDVDKSDADKMNGGCAPDGEMRLNDQAVKKNDKTMQKNQDTMMNKKNGKCAPCAPKNDEQKGSMWLWSLINHLVYGVVLGLVYRPRKKPVETPPPPSGQ